MGKPLAIAKVFRLWTITAWGGWAQLDTHTDPDRARLHSAAVTLPCQRPQTCKR